MEIEKAGWVREPVPEELQERLDARLWANRFMEQGWVCFQDTQKWFGWALRTGMDAGVRIRREHQAMCEELVATPQPIDVGYDYCLSRIKAQGWAGAEPLADPFLNYCQNLLAHAQPL